MYVKFSDEAAVVSKGGMFAALWDQCYMKALLH